MKKTIKKIIVYSALFGLGIWIGQAKADINPKDLMGDVAGHYIKNLNIPLPKIVNVPLPEQLDLGFKKTEYNFDNGIVMNFNTRDPLNQINITQGNHNYQITQDGLKWVWTKVLD